MGFDGFVEDLEFGPCTSRLKEGPIEEIQVLLCISVDTGMVAGHKPGASTLD